MGPVRSLPPLYPINNGMPLTGLSNSEVSRLIEKNLVKDAAFERIDVKTVMCTFPGQDDPILSRKIDITRSNAATIFEALGKFFSEVFDPKKIDERLTLIDDKLIRLQLLGKFDRAADDARRLIAYEQVIKAFINCCSIKLIVSEDCNHALLMLQKSEIYITAKKIAGVTRVILNIGGTILCISTGVSLI